MSTSIRLLLYSIFFIFIIGLINIAIIFATNFKKYYDIDKVPSKQVGIVLGALVYKDGRMSDMLKDRCDTAYELYLSNKIKKILVSGDHGRIDYDEVNIMKNYLINRGVKEDDLFLDHAGFDTYDSLYRARDIFKIESLIIISQEFHLPRSIYIANSLGIDAIGFVADKQNYIGGTFSNRIREVISNIKSFIDIIFQASPRYLGDSIPINVSNSKLTWDKK